MPTPAFVAPTDSRPQAPAAPVRGWRGWLVLGLCFGVGYGVTQRLVSIRLDTDWQGSQRFEVKPFPGTELDSLRRRFGDATMPIRGDLDLIELERQQKREAAEIEQRRADTEARERQQQESPAESESPPVLPDPSADLPPLPDPPQAPSQPAADPAPAAPLPPAAPTTTP